MPIITASPTKDPRGDPHGRPVDEQISGKRAVPLLAATDLPRAEHGAATAGVDLHRSGCTGQPDAKEPTMTMTTLPEVQETRTTEAPEAPARSRRPRFGWAAIGLALVATVALTMRVLDSAPAPTADPVWYSVEHGSIVAADHVADTAVRADRGSITAIDHAAHVDASRWYSVDRGSIAAIDHRAEAASPAGVAETSAEHGSPAAVDHEAADAER